MKKIKEIICSKDTKTISNFFNLYNEIEQEIKNRELQGEKNLKIAILSSFTIKGVKETLSVKCCELGVLPTFYIGGYNQYPQEILDPESGLYKFEPDLIIIFIDSATILGEQYLLPYEFSNEQRKNFIEEKSKEIQSLVQAVKQNSSAKIILHNLEVPSFSPLGILENKQTFGFIESIQTLNNNLRESYKEDNQVYLFDYDSFCSKIGKKNIIDYKMYYLGDIKIDLQHIPELCSRYVEYIIPLTSLTKKCIVLDLDNTLWGGIIGEDGLEGIKLGPTVEGRPFLEFQKYILSLSNRGIILAINSKNNPEDAMNALRNHPYMILKEEHFASIQINWDDKISNMRAIANEINIGLNSLVFFDDDKLNREMIKSALPEVKVVDLPEDPSLYLKTLMEINDFSSFHFSKEDKNKAKMYADQIKRQELGKTITDITEYLKALEMVVTIEKANSFTIPRISQLTQKTNQFNTTTKRYLEEDIKRFADSESHLVFSIKVEDKFGDNGITGVSIVEKKKNDWVIDSFLLSCRVIGRMVEEIMLGHIIEEAKKEGVRTLIGKFIPTKKNIPSKDFYEKNNFELSKTDGGTEIWEFLVGKTYKSPEFIKIIKN